MQTDKYTSYRSAQPANNNQNQQIKRTRPIAENRLIFFDILVNGLYIIGVPLTMTHTFKLCLRCVCACWCGGGIGKVTGQKIKWIGI